MLGGDLNALVTLLDDSVVLRCDGNGPRGVARRAVAGADRVARFLLGLPRLRPDVSTTAVHTTGGLGSLSNTTAGPYAILEVDIRHGQVHHVWTIRAADKLQRWTTHPAASTDPAHDTAHR